MARSANSRARVRAETAYEKVRQEKEARREQGQHSAPSFLRDARASVARGEWDYALAQADAASSGLRSLDLRRDRGLPTRER